MGTMDLGMSLKTWESRVPRPPAKIAACCITYPPPAHGQPIRWIREARPPAQCLNFLDREPQERNVPDPPLLAPGYRMRAPGVPCCTTVSVRKRTVEILSS